MSATDTFAAPDLPALDNDVRWSTWPFIAKGSRGPKPYPDWLITESAALDTELGILKTGKEADVHLLERAVPGDPTRRSLLAAKRYRDHKHRQFTRDGSYTAGRRLRKSRDQRAADSRRSEYGRGLRAASWAFTEFDALCRLYEAGAPVPYPVQLDDTEVLMEFIQPADADSTSEVSEGTAAPRLAQARPSSELLATYFEQLREAMGVFARLGWAHGDLSPYNVLATGERLVIIDVPQVVDLASSPFAVEFLHRDCLNMSTWFTAHGLPVDPDELFAEVYAQAF